MNIIQKIHKLIFSGKSVLDSFENALLDILEENLSESDKEIISSQRQLFNKVYRDNEEEKNKETSYFYWQYLGKSRIDFPKRFPASTKEHQLAELIVTLPSSDKIKVLYWVVNGILFSLEMHSESGVFRPLSPDFEVSDIKIDAL
ncbi:hypothetical protein KJ365_08715 [Glaciecola sp. XM2]|jgi:hypothetical protein|uniref:hypothetical protein n=1 Tax=Glaciecola sp. XM2 TaxID=1914931 RepID=UPI001BDDF416|nr:hypothetical protein [Glaciecola sp. XM2]MBT1450961.1 hypothetical protein [Glaciecola sp. XM2]